MYAAFFKRMFDVLGALSILLLLWPLMLLVALLVRCKLGTPILFRQLRPGIHGQIFTIYKFRTMTDKKDEDGNLLPDADRMTNFGSFLRSTSIDELPELFNILKGEMSFVGPRPLRVEYLPLYSEEQRHRHDVYPGLTGLAQVMGRNGLSWEERFKFDVQYTRNITFWGDFMIVWKTIIQVICRRNINAENGNTMAPFEGTK